MDSLFWTQLQPDVKYIQAKQLMFGLYPYRLCIRITASGFLRYPNLSFDDQLRDRTNRRSVNYGGAWRRLQMPTAEELMLLDRIRDIRADLTTESDVRMRIEDPNIQFYAKDESLLKDIALQIFAGTSAEQYLVDIITPASAEDLKLLEEGFVLKKSKYPFRVNIRDGRYSEETRINLISLLDAQAELVSVPPNTRSMLETDRSGFLWGCYFYCADESITLLVTMIHAKLVRSIDRYHAQDADK